MTDNQNMISIHLDSRQSSNVLYHELLIKYRHSEPFIYAIVEGKDDPSYYLYLIENILPKGWYLVILNAKSKQKLIDAYKIIDWSRFNKSRICFYIDRDFDDFIPVVKLVEKNVYVTERYSIENEIYSEALLINVVREFYGVNLTDLSSINTFKTCFQSQETVFFNILRPIVLQSISWRRKGLPVNFNNFDFQQFFHFNGLAIEFENINLILNNFSETQTYALCDKSEILLIEEEISILPSFRLIARGKYLIGFFIDFIKTLKDNLHSILPSIGILRNPSISFGEKNAVMVFGPRAKLPIRLESFLKDNYLSFIDGFEKFSVD